MKSIFLASLFAASTAVSSAAFVINEIDSDTPTNPINDQFEFVELKGNPDEFVTGLSLVFYNGSNGRAYYAVDLTGKADANGYYLAGTSSIVGAQVTWANNFLQNGEDAVAIYQRPSSDFVTVPASNGTPVTPDGIVDFIVYENGSATDGNWTGFGAPITVYNDQSGGNGPGHSLSRVPNSSGSFVAQNPTPGASNEVGPQPAALTVSPSNGIYFGRFNQANDASPAPRTVTLTNSGGENLEVLSFQVDPSSDSQFSSLPFGVPITLSPGQVAELNVFFTNTDVSQSQLFEGSVSYVTNAPTSASGSIRLAAEFVKVATPATGPGQLYINEIVYNNNHTTGGIQDYNRDGFADTTQDEFIELYNPSGTPIDVTGWVLTRENSSAQLQTGLLGPNTIIPGGGFLAIFGGGSPTGFAPGTATTSSIQLSNPGAKVAIGDGTTVVDRVSYLNTNDTPDADGYFNLPAIPEGNSIGRRPDGQLGWMEFVYNHPVPSGRPSPGLTNNAASSVSDWQLF